MYELISTVFRVSRLAFLRAAGLISGWPAGFRRHQPQCLAQISETQKWIFNKIMFLLLIYSESVWRSATHWNGTVIYRDTKYSGFRKGDPWQLHLYLNSGRLWRFTYCILWPIASSFQTNCIPSRIAIAHPKWFQGNWGINYDPICVIWDCCGSTKYLHKSLLGWRVHSCDLSLPVASNSGISQTHHILMNVKIFQTVAHPFYLTF